MRLISQKAIPRDKTSKQQEAPSSYLGCSDSERNNNINHDRGKIIEVNTEHKEEDTEGNESTNGNDDQESTED